MSSAFYLVNFEEVCEPKSQGGLGILHPGNMNAFLLGKWL